MQKSLSRYWLLLGVAALAIAGLFALVLVAARTPSLSGLPLVDALFHNSLVVHVDLSVLVWFLSIACLMWSLASSSRQVWPFLEEGALACFALGTLAVAASPLDPHGEALMSNYIPVISSPVFFTGLALLLCGVALMLIRLFCSLPYTMLALPSPLPLAGGVGGGNLSVGSECAERFPHPASPASGGGEVKCVARPSPLMGEELTSLRFGIVSSGLIAVIALVAFFWSYDQLPPSIGGAPIHGQVFYDLLFWGGGHVLQLVHTQILLVCWLLVMRALAPDFRPWPPFLAFLFMIGLFAACMAPLPYLLFDATLQEFRDFFTRLMMAGNAIAPLLLALWMLPALWRLRKGGRNALWSALIMSVLLFIYGGVLGGMIAGQNVVIPAHYHGSIVGVTLAFMGAAYLLLPRFGWRDVSGWKLAFWQPIIYGGGQILHISGLAWSGGYGVLRKTPGGLDDVSASVKAAMGLMGLGGVIAIIGGFMFVVVVGKAVLSRR